MTVAYVVAGGHEDGVDRIAGGAGEVILLELCPSALVWPMIGSMAFRRRSSRLIVGDVMPRVWADVDLGSAARGL